MSFGAFLGEQALLYTGSGPLPVAAVVTAIVGTAAFVAFGRLRLPVDVSVIEAAAAARRAALSRKPVDDLSVGEKASLLLRYRSYECGITTAVQGAKALDQLWYAEACRGDVAFIFGEDIAGMLMSRHGALFRRPAVQSDREMAELSDHLYSLATAALAQRAEFPERVASEIDWRLRPWHRAKSETIGTSSKPVDLGSPR